MSGVKKAVLAIGIVLAAGAGGTVVFCAALGCGGEPARAMFTESLPTPAYSNDSPAIPLTTSTLSPNIVAQGAIEIVLTPLLTLPVLSSDELAYAVPSGGVGGLRMTHFVSSNEFDYTLNQGLVGQVQAGRVDGRKLWVVGRKTHYLCTWGPAPSGGEEIQCCQQGACDQPTELSSSFVHTAAVSAVRFGETVSGTSLASYATWHRVAVYRDRLTPIQVREAAANAGVTPAYFVAALGDSITASFDGYHARLQQLIGNGAAVSNWGKSGDTAEMALARLPNALQAPQNVVCVLLGTNDVLNPSYNHTALETERYLKEIYGWVRLSGSTTCCVMTTTPVVNTSFGSPWYTEAHLAQQTALNTWVSTFSGKAGFVVTGAYALFNTEADGTFCGYPTLNSCSYDGLHPRGLYTIPPSPASPNGSDNLAAAVWAALGSPTHN